MPEKKPVNLLIVDDRPDGLLTMEAVLQSPEHNIVQASSGPEAIALLMDQTFAVILMDVQMPHMNGFEAATLIKRRSESRDIPIIFVTAISKDPRYVYQGYETGAVDYIFKPYDPQILRSKVAVFVELFRKNQQIQEQAEQLRQSEERFRLMIDGVKDYSIYMLDADGRTKTWTPAAEKMTGYKAAEVIGEPFSRFYTEEDRLAGKPERHLREAETEGRSEHEGWRVHKSGARFWAHVVLTPLRGPEGSLRGYAKVTRDVTDHKKTQDELRRKDEELHQARKIEAVGRLAGGVAHDFNNLITGILGITEDLKSELDERDPRRSDLQEIIKAANRAFSLTKQLLAFGRRQMVSPRVMDLNAVITDLNKMLLRLIGEDFQLTTILSPDAGRIKADPSQVEQVIINLLLNSRDAMPGGGRITIATGNIQFDENHARFHPEARPGPYVVLTVADTGCGMDENTVSQIFEPFFTTKEKDKGTGLGLSTVYGIVKQNGGEVFVDSIPSQGTTFMIFLPRVEAEVASVIDPSQLLTAAEGKETILVVEDEDIVRHVVRNILSKKGYRVLQASNGQEAIDLARRHEGPIDMIVTDVVMPGLNGRQVVEVVKAEHPRLAVLFMSGYTEDIINHRGILEPGISFIEKSSVNNSLAHKVRDLLDQRSSLRDKLPEVATSSETI